METKRRPQSSRSGCNEGTLTKHSLRPPATKSPQVSSPSWSRQWIKRYCCNIFIGIFLILGLIFLIQLRLGIWLLSYRSDDASHYFDKQESMRVASNSTTSSKLTSQRENNSPYLPSGYTPSCKIKTKDVISAINRASSDHCRIQIAEIACRSVDAPDGIGNLYPTRLPNFCPTAKNTDSALIGNYLGCYQDAFETRLLTGTLVRSHKDNSKTKCLRTCTNSGYSLAGLQFGNECFCGEKNIAELEKFRVTEERCNKKCGL